ncbi:N-acetyltransferase [uncultured Desulfovibrio sp.]|uniref:N-acetyltransferase n=1 Tax=uncultured Desulfovibrio sp. TaxID=167968 RepID=UPI002639A8A9|nr:N-acetyltransferase [uncultured Desulfovibrio sp.]
MAYDWPVRKAHMDDVKDIHALLLDCAQKGLLLPRALIFLYGHVRNFWVVDAPEGGIAACCALAPVWEDLGEICSLVVREDLRRHGLGRKVVEACMSDCEALHIRRVFSLTYQVEFFSRLGYEIIEKGALPQKIWSDCVHCAKYPDCCDETAVFKYVGSDGQ